jgi:hypothetical protein
MARDEIIFWCVTAGLAAVAIGGLTFLIARSIWRRLCPIPDVLRDELGLRSVLELNGVHFQLVFPREMTAPIKLFAQGCVRGPRRIVLQINSRSPRGESFEWATPGIDLEEGEVKVVDLFPPFAQVSWHSLSVSLVPQITGPPAKRYRRRRGSPYVPPASHASFTFQLIVAQIVPLFGAEPGTMIAQWVEVPPGTARPSGTIDARLLWTPRLWNRAA